MAFIESLVKMGLSATAKTGIFAAKMGLKGGWTAGKMGFQAAPSIARAGLGTAAFAIRHPYMTAGAIGGGMYLANNTSPYESPSLEGKEMSMNMSQESQAVDLMSSGVSPMGSLTSGAAVRNQRLMQSTQNLGFGLHQSRH